MHKIGFIYDEVFLKHSPPEWHPDKKARLNHILDVLKDSDIWGKLLHFPKADFHELTSVHTPEYVDMIRKCPEGFLDPDTYFSANSLEAALFAAGSVIEAVARCRKGEIQRAFCAVRPPGHHAEADCAMGFCIFNNIAVGSRYAQKIGYKKVFIIDFDAHHGNGTQHIFEEDDTVFYFITHQHPYYPDTGKDSERVRGRGVRMGTKMTMAEMKAGKYCGACHKGKEAFSVQECNKCLKSRIGIALRETAG
jgi:c(7)-type cytochrome triheme protein